MAQRQKYLRKITHAQAFGYKTIYQSETWCNANHTREYIWQLQDDEPTDLLKNTRWKSGVNVPSYIVLIIDHIGSEGAGEYFVGKKDSATKK